MIPLLKRLFRFSTIGPALIRFYLAPHVKLHYIHTSDAEFHDHPWNGLSIIFGSYWEELGYVSVLRRGFHYLPAKRMHRVIISKPVWTLFFNGRKCNPGWSYGQRVIPWEGSDQERGA